MADDYDSDDPMLAALSEGRSELPLTPSPAWFCHCLRLLPFLCKFHCRTCCACVGEMDCRAGLLVLLPLLAALTGVGLGAVCNRPLLRDSIHVPHRKPLLLFVYLFARFLFPHAQ